MEVVWAKSACGVWGLGHVFDGKLYFTRDMCEEKWIPKDLAPPKKSVPAPKARAKPAPKQVDLVAQAGAKPAPCSDASSSSAGATRPVPVMQAEHVQQFKACYSGNPEGFIVPLGPPKTSVLHESRGQSIDARDASLVFCLLASGEGTTVCLGIPLPPPPPRGETVTW